MHVKRSSTKKYFLLTAGVAALSSCSDIDVNYADKKVDDIYDIAMKQMKEKDYRSAAKTFLEVERHYPYSNLAVKAQLYSAYAHYEAGKYDEASEGFSLFVQLHPGHDEIPYALYMMGMCAYEQLPIVERDQEDAGRAVYYFEEILRRFPSSSYAKDAKLKIVLAKDHMAAKEMNIARYYISRYAYVAAINRFKSVVDNFQTTTHVPEALYRLVEAYKALGVEDQAKNHLAILGHNYADNQWYKKAYDLAG